MPSRVRKSIIFCALHIGRSRHTYRQTALAQFTSSSHEPIIIPSHRRTSVVVIIHFYCKLCLANQNLIKELFLFKLISKCISIIRRLLVLCGFNRTIFHIYWVQLWMLSRESMVYCRQSVIMDGSCITLISCDMCAMVWVARKTVFIHTSCIMYIASYSFELFAFLMRGEHIQESTDTCMLRI